MAKGAEKQKTNNMLNTAQAQSQQYSNNYLSQTAPERAQARSNANDMYGTMYGGLSDIAKTGGVTDELRNALGMGIGGRGVGGGVPVPNFSKGMYGDVQNSYRNFMGGGGVNLANNNYAMSQLRGLSSNGGWDPTRMASVDSDISGLKKFGQTGGLDDATIARMRGNGVFDEFAQSGGYSPTDMAIYRQRGTAGIPAQYQSAIDKANQMSGITGNFNPAAIAQMIRNSAYDTNKAALDTEGQLQDAIRSGRLQGAQGVAQNEQAIANLRTANQLRGLQGASQEEQALINSIAGNRISASGQLGNLDISGQDLIQRGKMFGTQGLEGIADKQAAAQRAAASAASANAANNAANAKWLAQFQTGNQMDALQGLGGLYTSTPGEVAYYDKMRQGTIDDNINNTLGVGQERIANNPQRNWFDTIMGGVGTAVGAATGLGLGGGARQIGNVKNFRQYL